MTGWTPDEYQCAADEVIDTGMFLLDGSRIDQLETIKRMTDRNVELEIERINQITGVLLTVVRELQVTKGMLVWREHERYCGSAR